MGPYSTNTEEVQKHVIYLNGTLSAEVTEMLAMFNMSVDELKRQQEIYKARRMESQNSGGFDAMTTTEMSKFSTSDDEWVDEMCWDIFLNFFMENLWWKRKVKIPPDLLKISFAVAIEKIVQLGRIFYLVFLLFCNKTKTLFWKCDKKNLRKSQFFLILICKFSTEKISQ